MERNRETRRAWISSSNGVNTRRNCRTHTLRENPDEDGGFDLQESARWRRERVRRDRERKRERRRDFREKQSRCKRRRGGDDTSDESFNEEEDDDDDEDEDEEKVTTASASAVVASARLFPPQRRKSFPIGSPVWKPGDETFVSSVPRKPRSASTKRSRDWISSRSSTVGVAEQILRQASTSPANQSGVVSSCFLKKKLKPNGNGAAGPKLKPTSVAPSLSKQNSSNPEKLEIEIAEVLFGLMNQSQGPSSKKESSRSNCGPKSSDSGPLQAVAPKRKRQSRVVGNPAAVGRPDPVEMDQASKSEVLCQDPEKVFSGEDGLEVAGSAVISSVIMEDVDNERESGAVKNDGNFCNDSPSIATASSTSVVFDNMIKANSTVAEVEIQREQKIDLMAPLPLDSILSADDGECGLLPDDESERKSEESKTKKGIDNGGRKIGLQFDLETPEISENLLQQHHEIPTQAKIEEEPLPSTSWPGGVPSMGCISSMDCGPTVAPSPIQLLQPSFTQPRPKRCATHCYIARNVQCLQQLVKMNPAWQAAVGPATLSRSKPSNLDIVPSCPVENVDHKASFSDSAQRKQQLLLQQALPPVGPSSSMGPTNVFPSNHQPVVAAASLDMPSSRTPHLSTGGKSSSNPSPSDGASTTAMSFNYPHLAAVNEPQYLAILQNQGYPFPMPSVAPAPNYLGSPPGQAVPFFNGSFYPSQMIHSSQIQHHQTTSAQPHPNSSPLNGPSSTQNKFMGKQPTRPEIEAKLGSAPTHKPLQLFQSNTRPRHLDIRLGREGSPTTTVDSGRGSCPPVKSIYGPNITMPVHLHQPQQFAMTFGTISGSKTTDISLSHQNLAIFQTLPEATRQNIQMIAAAGASQAAQSNNNNFRTSESRKSVGGGSSTNDASNVTESSGRAVNISSGAATRSSQPIMNLNAHHSHQGQLQQQQMVINRSKMLAASNGNVFPLTLSNSPQNNSTGMAQSPQRKNYSRAPGSPAPSSLASSSLTSSLKNPHSRLPTQTHNQISFGGNSKLSTNSQGQAPPSPSNSSVSKGSSRTTSSTSTNTKAGQSPIFSAQQSKKLHSNPSQKSPSILGNPTPVQPHMFFSNPYPQAQSPHSNSAGSTTSGPNGFYMQPMQARPNQHHETSTTPSLPGLFSFTSTTDPATGNVKGGRLISQGIKHTSQFGGPVVGGTLLPASFSYVQLKPAEQK